MISLGAPFFFPLIFGAIDLLLILVVVAMWFGVSSVRVQGDTLVVARGLIFPWRQTSYRAGDFQKRRIEVNPDDGLRAFRAGRRYAGPFDQQRFTNAALVEHPFRAT